MKPTTFDYVVAASVEEAMELVERDEDAKFIAGGQSLLPLLSLRFATPSLLVDIGRIPGLNTVESDRETLTIGALTPHSQVARNDQIRKHAPLLAEAAGWVAHAQVRNRGTLGGAVAHSDAAAEFPAVLLAYNAAIVTASKTGRRKIAAEDFFGSHYQTSLEHGELIVAIEIPYPAYTRWGFHEFARRKGDYAIGGAALVADVDSDGTCKAVRAGLIAAGAGPTLARGLQESLVGRIVDLKTVTDAAARAGEHLKPESNTHGSSRYRQAVIEEALRRALCQAFALNDDHTRKKSA